MSTATDIFVTAGKVKRIITKWINDPHDFPIPEEYWESLDRLLKLCESEGLPDAFVTTRYVHLVMKTKEYLDAYREMIARVDRKPMPEFFNAQSLLCDEILDWPNLHTREKELVPVKELVEQGVQLHQIALIYGLKDPRTGVGLSQKIRQELENPGSVIGPDYVHPDEVIRLEKRKVIEEWLQDDFNAAVECDGENNAPRFDEITTIGQAYAAGLSVGEAADHLDLPVSQVKNFYEKEDEAKQLLDESQDDDSNDPDWSKGMSFDELREMAGSIGVSTRSNMKRETVIERIEAAQESSEV